MMKTTFACLTIIFALALMSSSKNLVIRVNAENVCKVTDPTGTPLNVRSSPNGRIIGKLKNNTEVYIEETSTDSKGRPWAKVSSYRKGVYKTHGWIFREFISCYNR